MNGIPIAVRPKSFDQMVQDIASAAHARGVYLIRGKKVVGSIEARLLCRSLRAAHVNTTGQELRRAQVLKLAAGIALRLGVKGPLLVPQVTWNVLSGFAKARQEKQPETQPVSA